MNLNLGPYPHAIMKVMVLILAKHVLTIFMHFNKNTIS